MDRSDGEYFSPKPSNAGVQNLAEGACKDSRGSLKISSIQDIKNNLGSLGSGKRVLIWHGLLTNMMNSPRRDRIYNFACHLMTYGFIVKMDMFVSHANEIDWASWTDHEVSQADWIICVCSQSSYILFQSVNDLDKEIQLLSLEAKNARFYSRMLYNRILTDVQLKVIPVVLLREDDDLAFIPPTLRDPKNILHIYEDTPFCTENLNGNFERLVCRMAGIDRIALNATEYKHQGYVKLPSKISENGINHFVKPKIPQRGIENSHTSSRNYYDQQSGMMQNGQASPKQQSCHLQMPAVGTMKNPLQYNYYDKDPLRKNHSLANGFAENSAKYTPKPQYVPPQPSTPVNYGHHGRYLQSSQMQTTNSTINGHHSKLSSRPVQQKVSGNGSLPNSKIPHNSPILLKLSQDVREWKFLGRYLDLEEETIDEIDYNTIPNRTRDKALKVLTEWVNISTPTWKALGEALLDAEYVLLYEKLLELISGY